MLFSFVGWRPSSWQGPLLCLEGGGVDDEPVADVGGKDAFVGVVDLVGRDDLDFGADAVFGAEVEHFLGFADAADHGPGKGPASQDEGEGLDREWFRGCTHVDQGAVEPQQLQVGVDVDAGADGVDDQIEAAGQLGEGVFVTGGVVVVGAQAQAVFLLLQ